MTARQTQLRRVVDGLGGVYVRLRAPKNVARRTAAALPAGSDAPTVITVGKPALGQSYISAEPTR
jgi:hypothetical protein